MGGHHLVLGEMRDYLTGETRVDTHDERYRQKIARLLVEKKGFRQADLSPRVPIDIRVDGKQARVRLDLIVRLTNESCCWSSMLPVLLTTRHQVALAASRLLAPLPGAFQCRDQW